MKSIAEMTRAERMAALDEATGMARIAVRVAKMTHKTNLFNANQKVWLQCMSGSLAAKVIGKHRGKGRYISAWIRWDTATHPAPEWRTIEVDKAFARRYTMLEWEE